MIGNMNAKNKKPNVIQCDLNVSSLGSVVQAEGFNVDKEKGQKGNHVESGKNVEPGSNYRPDIDGLRTVAVSIVIAFHAWPQLLPGGFIGVDIFFVISGYLISQIIIKQTLKNKFCYSDFYTRRIKRIYPTLLAVLSTVSILSCTTLLQGPLKIVSKTMAASTVFSANIEILTYQKDYFDPDVKTNPLLHLWSLGVEEQFYIVWPFCLHKLITRCKHTTILYTLSAITAVSFGLNVVGVYANPKFSFYFPLARFWEISVGSIIAYTGFAIKNATIANLLTFVSVMSISLSVCILNQESLFPGWWAIVPTMAAALLIISGNKSLINRKILSSNLFVFIGKISYSLYLWHWPLLVFSRLLYPAGSHSLFARPQIILSLCLTITILNYYIVENPLRHLKSKALLWILVILMISIGLFSIAVYNDPKSFSILERNLKQFINFL